MTRPTVLVFDVHETLLDLSPLRAAVAKLLGDREELVPLWFTTTRLSSVTETLSETHQSFVSHAAYALHNVARSYGIELTPDEVNAAVALFWKLPPYDDVPEGLKALQKEDFRLVALTNSAAEDVEAQLQHAGIADLFEKCFSIETVRKFKPHADTYQMVLNEVDVTAENAMMVAAQAWDISGAKKVGLQTAFIARSASSDVPAVRDADIVVQDVKELAGALSSP